MELWGHKARAGRWTVDGARAGRPRGTPQPMGFSSNQGGCRITQVFMPSCVASLTDAKPPLCRLPGLNPGVLLPAAPRIPRDEEDKPPTRSLPPPVVP